MNTNRIKSFAKEARILLYNGVSNQLKFWGFDEQGNVLAEPETIPGGYTFRGKAFNDVSVTPRWRKLKEKIQKSQEAIRDVTEEAAYTWFNRLIAIKILEENGFIDPVIRFQEGTTVPLILQQAKGGQHAVSNAVQKANLQEALLGNDDEKAFAIVITQYCNSHPLLKEVFGHLDDYTEILIPNDLLTADGFVAMLNDEDCIASDDFKEVELIGWLYQFYISDRKDEVFKGFKANKKARAEDIPAATQIFTPKWIVNYMVENTVGKIYLDYEEDSDLRSQMKYLVENDSDSSELLIDDITKLTLIDPACGSGHILVVGFEWLYKMYREQGYGAKQAIESILKHNLFGLDLDNRAMQLSRFAVLLKAAQQMEAAVVGEGKNLLNQTVEVLPHVYAFPEEHGFITEEIAIFTGNQHVKEIYSAIDLLRQGKNIGSALKLSLSEEAKACLLRQYYQWSDQSKAGTLDIDQQGIWEQLKPYVEVVLTLTKQYAAVMANPPYMSQKSMNTQLKDYVNVQYPLTKSDLFAVFMEVCLNLSIKKGLMGMINQHSWMFLSSYEKLREELLNNYSIINMIHLGPRTFEELSGEVVQSTAFVCENGNDTKTGTYFRLVDYRNNIKKEAQFLQKSNQYANIAQSNFEKIPGSPIAYWISANLREIFKNGILSYYAPVRKGIDTGKNDVFLRFWHEVSCHNLSLLDSDKKWFIYIKGGSLRKWYGNVDLVVNWENDGYAIKNFKGSTIRNKDYIKKNAITWSLTGNNGFGARFIPENCVFDNNGSSVFPTEHTLFILGSLNSKVTETVLSVLNPTLAFQVGDIARVPIVWNENFEHSSLVETNIKLSKADWDSRETSWDFERNPLLAQKELSLTKAYEAWQDNLTNDFLQLHTNEEELNRIFIDIYGLQEELTPDVPLKDITILQEELKSGDLAALEPDFRAGKSISLPIQKDIVISQLLSYLVGCILGRYRLDRPGIHIAHPNPTDEETAFYQVENVALPFTMQTDDDAILPLMGEGCAFPDDAVKRVEEILHRIYGDKSHNQNMNFINGALGMKLDKWMTEKFWPYHISGSMYKKKPIYWLFTSNPKKPQAAAFRVLVYMHRMDAYTVQKIMRNYLHPHQEYLRNEYEALRENEANLSKQELKKYETIQQQMIELREYNEVLKGLADQQITFDLDDGVTVNYAKFEGAVAVIK